MTSVEEIRDAILQLTAEQRARLMAEVGPDFCRAVMQNPEIMAQMMPRCEEMMTDPGVRKSMGPMMERMTEYMTPGGPRHG